LKIRSLFFSLLVLVAGLFVLPGFGQRSAVLNMPMYDTEPFHFGFVLGINVTHATIRPVADLRTRVFDSTYIPDILPMPDSAKVLTINASPVPGFVVSIVANMQLGKHFELQFVPSLSFGDRTLVYEIETYRLMPGHQDPVQLLTINKKVPSTYINFPLEIKYKAMRYNNFRPYLMTGIQYSLDLASNAKKREQKNRNEKIVKFTQNDIYAEAGVGFDFYNEWFKLGIELKMMYGLFDVLKRENNIYTESLEKVSSKIFQLSFTFQ
jgi:hypothetical protein